MTRLRLPIGIQTLRKIREEGYYYVDKTPYIEQLLEHGGHFFLSRPRRFGKSLFVDTLKELFEGNEALFEGLHIHPRWDWSARHPVVRLSFGRGDYEQPGYLHINVMAQLDSIERRNDVRSSYQTSPERLHDIVERLHEGTGKRVVILVDEYDRPILDALGDSATATANRNYLRGLYSVVKDSDAHLELSFITGISKFSRVNLFSTLNNLDDLTLDRQYSSICGYTDQDLDEVFAPELEGLDRAEIRKWYNGYSWLGEEKVYNPFDILRLFRQREFHAWWSETGSTKFLVDTLTERKVGSIALEKMSGDNGLLSRFDVGDIGTEALLFQTGYLTIVGEKKLNGRARYELGYPNLEVRQALNEDLLGAMVPEAGVRVVGGLELREALTNHDFEDFEKKVRSLFASIPYEWYTNNPMAGYEGYYASVFFSCLAAAGLDIVVEDSTNLGRVDMTVRVGGDVFVFEFKVLENAGEGAAMRQLEEREYAQKYLGTDAAVHLVGVEFSKETRNVEKIEARLAS